VKTLSAVDGILDADLSTLGDVKLKVENSTQIILFYFKHGFSVSQTIKGLIPFSSVFHAKLQVEFQSRSNPLLGRPQFPKGLPTITKTPSPAQQLQFE